MAQDINLDGHSTDRLPAKNPMGIPRHVALVPQSDRWILHNAIVEYKPNAIPESVHDRPPCRYGSICLLTCQPLHHFDVDAIRRLLKRPEALTEGLNVDGANKKNHRCSDAGARRRGHHVSGQRKHAQADAVRPGDSPHTVNHPPAAHTRAHPKGRNPEDLRSIPTRPYSRAHFAAFSIDLPLRAIAAGRTPDGVLSGCLSRAGTTIVAVRILDRRAIDVDPAYHRLTQERLRHQTQESARPDRQER